MFLNISSILEAEKELEESMYATVDCVSLRRVFTVSVLHVLFNLIHNGNVVILLVSFQWKCLQLVLKEKEVVRQ